MKLLEIYSIKHRLAAVISISTAVALLISAALFVIYDHITIKQQISSRLTSQVNIIGSNATVALLFNDQKTAAEVLTALRSDRSVINADIHTSDGNLFASYRNEKAEGAWALSEQLNIEQDIVYQNEVIGSVSLHASTHESQQRLSSYILISLAVMLVALVGALLLSSRLQRMIYVPIQHLAETARNVKQQRNYGIRATKYEADELGSLTEDFNAMLVEIQQHDENLESLVAKRSTELRKKNRALNEQVSKRKEAQIQLQESERKFKGAFYGSAVGMALANESLEVLQANPATCNMLGYSKAELTGKSFIDLSHPDDLATCISSHKDMLAGKLENWQLEKRYIHKEGHIIWVSVTVSAVRDKDDDYLYSVLQIQDITEAHQLTEKLAHQASHDALTGLNNRREFEQQLDELLADEDMKDAVHALCYIDLDQFKVINDTCGHVAGDELLRQLTQLMKQSVRVSDTLARLGGDEFGILMKRCSLEQAQRVISEIREMISEFRFGWAGKTFSIGVSIGLVPISDTKVSMTELLQRADTACYAAKDSGRNRLHIFHEEDEDMIRRHGEMQWVARINRALEEDRLVLYRQAIIGIDKESSECPHYELLVRMRDEEGNIIPPGAFLPAAERFDLASKIDRRVVEIAFTWLRERIAAQEELPQLSINLSGLSLGDEHFLDFITQALADGDIPANKLCFEVTETAAIANLAAATTFIQALKALGCLFALDDFGSGLSSFAYLKNLPVDFLKIDGVFVKDIVDDPIDYAMVKSINEVGHVMGKRTIAEFVENDQILEMLEEIGVDYAQGYGVGMPEPLYQLPIPEAISSTG